MALGLYDVTMAFVSSQLSFTKLLKRRSEYSDLCERLGKKLGGRGFQLNEQFHHVVWMGDLGYKTASISAEQALGLVTQGRHKEMLLRFDELQRELEDGHVFYGYKEPVHAPDFLPTYRKHTNRHDARVAPSDPAWAETVYNTQFQQSLFRGGGMAERVPSWPDRILYHSLPSRDGELVPEPMIGGAHDNYHAVESPLDFCEHSPVFCTFDLEIDADDIPTAAGGAAVSAAVAAASGRGGAAAAAAAAAADATSTLSLNHRLMSGALDMPVNVIITVHKVVTEYRGQMRSPRAINILFPLPFEDSDSLPERAKSMRAGGVTMGAVDKSSLVTATTKMLVSRASRVQRFHLLMKVRACVPASTVLRQQRVRGAWAYRRERARVDVSAAAGSGVVCAWCR